MVRWAGLLLEAAPAALLLWLNIEAASQVGCGVTVWSSSSSVALKQQGKQGLHNYLLHAIVQSKAFSQQSGAARQAVEQKARQLVTQRICSLL